jgi:NitT/TauT family transport system ATP-binding protein/sulfonate transport system ATP-binding protein
MSGQRQQKPSLSVRQLSKGFIGRNRSIVPVLRDVNLEVADGECVSILGPSGSGKSTLLRLISGLERLNRTDAGEILINGKPPARAGGRVGFVFQSYSSFPWLTVNANVLLATKSARVPRGEREQEVAKHLASVRLAEFKDSYPDQLSGGQRQRLAFACALAMQPALLLMDEPMGALDAITREHLQVELLRLWLASRRTMILVTHDISEALLLGHRVIVLSGRPATVGLELDTSLAKPWLQPGTIDPLALESMIREMRRRQAFLEMADRLRDALA